MHPVELLAYISRRLCKESGPHCMPYTDKALLTEDSQADEILLL